MSANHVKKPFLRDDKSSQEKTYQILVEGRLGEHSARWFNGMATISADNTTTLTGHVVDQAALRGILCHLWDLNLTILSVTIIDPEASREREVKDG